MQGEIRRAGHTAVDRRSAMSRLRISVVALCVAFLLSISAAARADQQADDLYKQYKSYKSKGQYDLAAKAVCDSAKIDSKYQNECDQVSTYVNGRLQDFETDRKSTRLNSSHV